MARLECYFTIAQQVQAFYNLLITPLDKAFRLKLALFILETDYGTEYKILLDHFDINT